MSVKPVIRIFRYWCCLRCGGTGALEYFDMAPDQSKLIEAASLDHRERRPACEASLRPEDAKVQIRGGEAVISI
jgi:hypothetical protein